MAYSEVHPSKRSSQHDVSTKKFFDGLVGRAKKAAFNMAEQRANKMQQILVHRWLLGSAANGRFPRWDGSNNTPSLKSFSKWSVRPNGVQGFILYNDATDIGRSGGQGYSYVRNLVTGKYWNKRTRSSMLLGSKLIRNGSLIFSEQMPNGLTPWLNDQRQLLKKDIDNAIRGIT